MSPTCRQHVADIAKCRQILADIACRCDTEEAPTYPIYVNYSRQVQVSPNVRVSYPTIEFLCLNSNNNPTCREFPDMSSNVVSFRHSSRHDIFLCLRHDQRRVATCRRHDTECRRLGNKNDTPTSDITG